MAVYSFAGDETIIGIVRNGAKHRAVLSTDFYGGKKGMKNGISSIMDASKKKAGFIILCVVLVAIIGTGVALAVTNNENGNNSTIESIAQEFINNEILKYEQIGVEIIDSKISFLELVSRPGFDNLADRTVYVFLLEYRLLPKDLSKAELSLPGGMRIDENGWITEWSSMGHPLIVAFEEERKAELIGFLWSAEISEKNGGLEAAVKALLERKNIKNINDQLDMDVEFTNGWRSPLVDLDEKGKGGKFIIVQFGSLKNDREQGIAVVCHQNKDSEQYVIDDQFLTPSKHGAIKIENLGAKDFNMSVVAEDGYKWIFNIYNGFTPSGDQIAEGKIYADLTQELQVKGKELYNYQLFTNSEKISVSIPNSKYTGEFVLYDAENDTSIQQFKLNGTNRTKTFGHLTAATNYYILASGMDDVIITISD
jgi:hypothetical protein